MAPPKAPPKISQSAAPVDITHHPHHLSAGVIAGSTVGAIAGLVLLVVLVSFLQLHRRRRRKLAAEAAAAAAAAAAPNDKPQLHSDDVKPVRTELDAGIKSKPLPPKEMAAKEELIRTVSEMPANEIVGSEMET
jgi:flagellar biosynthesis/type III secretory pathway M-ring protein FliF/YscJ